MHWLLMNTRLWAWKVKEWWFNPRLMFLVDSVSRMCSKYLISLDLRSGIRHASLVRMTHQRATYYIWCECGCRWVSPAGHVCVHYNPGVFKAQVMMHLSPISDQQLSNNLLPFATKPAFNRFWNCFVFLFQAVLVLCFPNCSSVSAEETYCWKHSIANSCCVSN